MRVRLLLTGGSGFLGHWLVGTVRDHAHLALVRAGRSADDDIQLDLSDPGSVTDTVRAARPDLVLHAAALSRMGECEANPALARAVNAEAPARLAAACPRMLMVSTDLVFDGRTPPYGPADAPNPLSVYGRSKALGETAVLGANANHLVARLPLLFGPSFDGQRGATDMFRRAAREGRSLRLFANEFRQPLHARDAAAALVALLLDPAATGVHHIVGPERVSRHGLARRFQAATGLTLRCEAVDCDDPARPRDLALEGAVAGPDLDTALAAC